MRLEVHNGFSALHATECTRAQLREVLGWYRESGIDVGCRLRVVNSEGEPVRGAEVRVTAGEQSVTLHSADHGYALYAPAEDGEAERAGPGTGGGRHGRLTGWQGLGS